MTSQNPQSCEGGRLMKGAGAGASPPEAVEAVEAVEAAEATVASVEAAAEADGPGIFLLCNQKIEHLTVTFNVDFWLCLSSGVNLSLHNTLRSSKTEEKVLKKFFD